MVLAMFLAAVFSSPLFFTQWWQLRWFRNTWWIFLGIAVVGFIGSRNMPAITHATAVTPALPTAGEFFAVEKPASSKADLQREWEVEQKRDLALAACKVSVLDSPGFHNDAGVIENYFNACMASRGYRFSYADMCTGTAEHHYLLGSNPAYNYVVGTLDLGENGIEQCYVDN